MKFRELSAGYSNNLKSYRAEDERIDKQIARLKKKQSKLKIPNWMDELVKPIAIALLPHLEGYDRYDILGPFGICNECSIHFIAVGSDKGIDRDDYFARLKSLTFILGDLDKGELLLRDISTDTGEFAKGTIGAMNGMNHPTVAIDPDTDLMDLLDKVR